MDKFCRVQLMTSQVFCAQFSVTRDRHGTAGKWLEIDVFSHKTCKIKIILITLDNKINTYRQSSHFSVKCAFVISSTSNSVPFSWTKWEMGVPESRTLKHTERVLTRFISFTFESFVLFTSRISYLETQN